MSTQTELLEILPTLVSDLYEGKLDTLDKFSVKWTHVNVMNHEPDTELESYILKDFTVSVADGIKLQCSREYWDEEEISEPRATQLHKLPKTSISNIATDNTEAERTLARFGYLASISARSSNKKFTAKRIRDDMTLDRCDEIDVPRDSRHKKSIRCHGEKVFRKSKTALQEKAI